MPKGGATHIICGPRKLELMNTKRLTLDLLKLVTKTGN